MRRQQHFRRFIQSLSPYTSLIVLGIPVASVELLKVAAVFFLGDGHWVTGTIVVICAYALSLFLVERLFVVAKPKLLMIPWFAALWRWFVAVRSKLLGWLRSAWTSLTNRRQGAQSRQPPRARARAPMKVKRAR